MTREYHEALKLSNKMYLNSYECMWNDAMIHAKQRNFYFFDPKMVAKITEEGQKQIRKIC